MASVSVTFGPYASLMTLVEQARGGNAESRNALLCTVAPRIRRAVGQAAGIGGGVGAEDVAQETLVRIDQGLPSFRGETEGEFLRWLHQIARNTLADAMRRLTAMKRDVGATQALTQEPAHVPRRSPESDVDQAERSRRVNFAISSLDDTKRHALLMALEGYSHPEIGEALGCTSEAARKRVLRAEKDVRVELERRAHILT